MPPIESQQAGEVITNPDREVVIRHDRVTVRRTDDSSIDGRGQAANGVRVHDGNPGFVLENLYIKRCGSGVFATNSDDGEIIGCTADRCGAEGFQSGGPRRLVVEDCQSFGHTENTWEGPDLGTQPDRSHGFYFDCPGSGWDDSQKGLIMRRCVGRDNDGMGVHLRGAFLLIEDSDFTMNRPGSPGGAGDAQLSGARNVIFRRCLLQEGDSGITLYEQARDVRMEECCIWSPAGSFATSCWDNEVLVVQGGVVCGRIDKTRPDFQPPGIYYSTPSAGAAAALDAWMGTYRSSTPPEPPVVEPPPETGNEVVVAELEAALASIDAGIALLKEAGVAGQAALAEFQKARGHVSAALAAAQA